MLILLVLVLVLIFASLWDYKKRKIPNLLIAVGYIYGLMRIFYYQNFLTHILGIIVPILILYPFFKIGTIGAGDIKLFSLIGCYLSFMEVLYCMFLTFVIGAIVSLVFMQREGNFAGKKCKNSKAGTNYNSTGPSPSNNVFYKKESGYR